MGDSEEAPTTTVGRRGLQEPGHNGPGWPWVGPVPTPRLPPFPSPGNYRTQLWDKQSESFLPSTPGLGMHVEVKDPDGKVGVWGV